jgi:tRNA1Val (adenine37-N6)-methyltransferase
VLKEGERIDDLQLKNLKIIQNPKGFCFGVDAVLLANFAEVKNNAKVLDMGTGTGIIPLILYGKTKAKIIHAMEIQKEVAEMCLRSFNMNNTEDRIKLVTDSILNWQSYYKKHEMDVVLCNPPYKAINSGILNNNDYKTISRHENSATLEDFISTASNLLNSKGKFFMIHRPHRLAEIFEYCTKYRLAVKKLVFVHGKPTTKPNMVLVKAIKEGKGEVLVDAPLYVHNEDGTYTQKIHEIYGEMWTGGF